MNFCNLRFRISFASSESPFASSDVDDDATDSLAMKDDVALSKFVNLLVDAGAEVESTTFSSLPTSSSFT